MTLSVSGYLLRSRKWIHSFLACRKRGFMPETINRYTIALTKRQVELIIECIEAAEVHAPAGVSFSETIIIKKDLEQKLLNPDWEF